MAATEMTAAREKSRRLDSACHLYSSSDREPVPDILFVELILASGEHDIAAFHHGDALCEAPDKVEILLDEEDRHIPPIT